MELQRHRTVVVELTTASIREQLARIVSYPDREIARARMLQLWAAVERAKLKLEDDAVHALEVAKDQLGL
jgi:hypothetical protein